MLSMEKWMIQFLEQYRFEGLKLGPKDKIYLEPYVKEQLLSPPCEVQAVIFARPFCLLFLFFFSPHIRDRQICLHSSSWSRIHFLIGKFSLKYSTLHVDYKKLETNINRIHQNLSEASSNRQTTMYGIGALCNVAWLYFCQDFRIEVWPWSRKGRSDPSEVARHIFRINYCQAIDERTSGQILDAAVKELERYGYRKVEEQGK